MTKRATFTQAELDRALQCAARRGLAVEIDRGIIRIVEPDAQKPLPSAECDDRTEIDRRFGCDT